MTRSRGSLTSRQVYALHLLKRCAGVGDGWGVVSSDPSVVDSGQAWIHWRTAEALRARGLVEVERLDIDAARLRLTEAGWQAVARA